MGVYLSSMEMPKNCWECPLQEYGNCFANGDRPIDKNIEKDSRDDSCPLVSVPPHGRLIDADALVDSFAPSDFWNPDAEDNCFAAIHVVNCAPTVIEAEEGE